MQAGYDISEELAVKFNDPENEGSKFL
jgi:hypothetical protein